MKPKLSIISAIKYGSKYVEDNILSIINQSYTNFEYIIVDGGCIDDSIEKILAFNDSRIKIIKKNDKHTYMAYSHGLSIAKGDLIIITTITDGFIDRNWFAKCVNVLDSNKELSGVFGMSANMDYAGNLKKIDQDDFVLKAAPTKEKILPFYLATNYPLPELNICIYKNVYKSIFGPYISEKLPEYEAFQYSYYKLITHGYLIDFIPTIANFGRDHKDSITDKTIRAKKWPYKNFEKYRRRFVLNLLFNKFSFKDKNNKIIRSINIKTKIKFLLLIFYYKLTRKTYSENFQILDIYNHIYRLITKTRKLIQK